MFVYDLIPGASGFANLGVDVDSNSNNAFDITSIAPFNQIHLNSGVYHDPLMGQSGVIRYSRQRAAFQMSVDGGLTFNDVPTSATVVTSVGVIGGADLTGNVDLSSSASGFLVIGDTGGASPITFNVDQLGLSGLWRFPAQGFNGSIVNALTDFNGTTAQGVINVVGASGIVADIIGQTLTITPGPSGGFTTMHVQAFSAATIWTVQHNLNTVNVVFNVYNNANPCNLIIPDQVVITNANAFAVKFNVAQAGRIIVIGSRGI